MFERPKKTANHNTGDHLPPVDSRAPLVRLPPRLLKARIRVTPLVMAGQTPPLPDPWMYATSAQHYPPCVEITVQFLRE